MKRTTPGRSKRTAPQGYTLVEIMVVLVIMGLMAAAVGLNMSENALHARQQTARMEMHTLADALELYQARFGRYPSTSEGIQPLIEQKLVKGETLDPWGHPYVYRLEGGAYSLTSLGADGAPGGTGGDADLTLGEEPAGHKAQTLVAQAF